MDKNFEREDNTDHENLRQNSRPRTRSSYLRKGSITVNAKMARNEMDANKTAGSYIKMRYPSVELINKNSKRSPTLICYVTTDPLNRDIFNGIIVYISHVISIVHQLSIV
jgi:hypothetical protein